MSLAEFDPDLHDRARALADYSIQSWPEGQTAAMARAYLDLLNRRGLPTPLKCYPSIQLISGSYFDFLNPEQSEILPEDIAHSLSKVARCGGHTLGDYSYSVAQHSVLVSKNAPVRFRFEALMHDAPEYVCGDTTTPLKQLLPDYQIIEDRVHRAIANKFYLPLHMSPEVKIVDVRMAATEKRDLMPKDAPGEGWEMLQGIEPYAGKVEVWSAPVARDIFLQAFYDLWPIHESQHRKAQ